MTEGNLPRRLNVVFHSQLGKEYEGEKMETWTAYHAKPGDMHGSETLLLPQGAELALCFIVRSGLQIAPKIVLYSLASPEHSRVYEASRQDLLMIPSTGWPRRVSARRVIKRRRFNWSFIFGQCKFKNRPS